jgi:replicative DNA helicase
LKKAIDLPHDLLSEKSLLGCLLVDGGAFDEIVSLSLQRGDFYHPQYGTIFECIQDLVNSRSPIDFVTLCSKLSDLGKLESLGDSENKGQSFILTLIEDQASAANIVHYAQIVKNKSVLRELVRTADKISSEGKEYSGDVTEFISKVESRFFKLTQDVRGGGMKKLSACLLDNLKELEDQDRRPGELSGISTGYDNLDARLLGMQAGQLIIVAARPGMGKTAFGLNVAINSVKRSGLPVAIFSLEMLSNELSMRILSSEAKVDSKRLRTKSLRDTELKSIGSAIQRLANYHIYINDDGGVTILDIQSECRKIKAENSLGLVVVDYVQLMRSHTGNPSREQQISEISRGLKGLAKELECPIIALSQLNRGVESRTDKRPNVSDLRESGALEQDADVVMLIYRDDFYFPDTSKDKGMAEIIVGKNRAGETGTVRLAWKGSYTTFVELANEQNFPNQPQHGNQSPFPE